MLYSTYNSSMRRLGNFNLSDFQKAYDNMKEGKHLGLTIEQHYANVVNL